MSKDYSNFNSVVKVRFRKFVEDIEYEQITGQFYAQKHDGWYNVISIQKPAYGGSYFTFEYGVSVPNHWSLKEETISKDVSMIFYEILTHKGSACFQCTTKKDIEQSVEIIRGQFNKQAKPWLNEFTDLASIVERFSLRFSSDGHTSCRDALDAANYGFLLYRCDRKVDSLPWLKRAAQIISSEWGDLQDYEAKQLSHLNQSIRKIGNELK